MKRVALLAALWLTPTSAFAFCRTTTCDPSVSCDEKPEDCCILDLNFCDTNGLPLSWPSSCVSYSINDQGSAKRNISAEQTRDVIDKAFAEWSTVSCQGEPVAIGASYFGAVSCDQHVFNDDAGNANIWLFRDVAWPYDDNGLESSAPVPSNALAVTTVSFNWKTAEMLDADVEFNSEQMPFTIGDSGVQDDLLSIATHEAGHFLGLDHSLHPSTMEAYYSAGSITPRTLNADDKMGICAIYPPGRKTASNSCEPSGGFSDVCNGKSGCAFGAAPARGAPSGWALGALVAAGWLARRSTKRRAATP